jgi:hypothetical protein
MKLTVDMSSGKGWTKAAWTFGDDKIGRERTTIGIEFFVLRALARKTSLKISRM